MDRAGVVVIGWRWKGRLAGTELGKCGVWRRVSPPIVVVGFMRLMKDGGWFDPGIVDIAVYLRTCIITSS